MKVGIKKIPGYQLESKVGDIVEARTSAGSMELNVKVTNNYWEWLWFPIGDYEIASEEELEMHAYDFVNPSHYKKFEKETYEMMIAIWGEDAYIKHCEMCAFKYKLRAGEKPDQPVERDLEKANWYLEMANKLRKK